MESNPISNISRRRNRANRNRNLYNNPRGPIISNYNLTQVKNKLAEEAQDINQLKQQVQSLKLKKQPRQTNLQNAESVITKPGKGYEYSLRQPDDGVGIGVSKAGAPTFKWSGRVMGSFTTNASGNAALLWFPNSLSDSTSNSGLLLVDNAVGVNGAVEAVTGWTSTNANYGAPAGMFKTYRLVSAQLEIYSIDSSNNAKGEVVLACGETNVLTNLFAYGVTTLTYNAFTAFTLANQAKIRISEPLGAEHDHVQARYVPYNNTDTQEMLPMNQSKSIALGGSPLAPIIFGYVTGAGNASTINYEIIANWECEVDGGPLDSSTTVTSDRTDPMDAVYRFRNSGSVVTCHSASDKHKHMFYAMVESTVTIDNTVKPYKVSDSSIPTY